MLHAPRGFTPTDDEDDLPTSCCPNGGVPVIQHTLQPRTPQVNEKTSDVSPGYPGYPDTSDSRVT